MKKSDLEKQEKEMMALVVQKRQLGGYNAEAEGVLKLAEVMLKVVQHLVEEAPEDKPKAGKKSV